MKMFGLIASCYGFIGVALGAFGAHGLHAQLGASGRLENWETATLYLFVHSIVLLFVSLRNEDNAGNCLKVAGWSFVFGILIFSGSLYVLSLTNVTKLGMIAPVGVTSLLVGWGALIIGFLKK